MTYAGPERRFRDRTPPPPPRVIGRARLRRLWARAYPALRAGEWYPVLERNPNILLGVEGGWALPNYLWLDMPGKALHVRAKHFEVEPVEPV